MAKSPGNPEQAKHIHSPDVYINKHNPASVGTDKGHFKGHQTPLRVSSHSTEEHRMICLLPVILL